MILFLDFDGVLHPDAVYKPPGKPLVLRADGELMMHAPILERILDAADPDRQVRIVLSTSWIRVLGYGKTLKYLPAGLQAHVKGGTWHKEMRRQAGGHDPFDYITRFEQIAGYVSRHAVQNWLVLDDLHSGDERWPEDLTQHLVLTDSRLGLGCLRAQEDLRLKLEHLIRQN